MGKRASECAMGIHDQSTRETPFLMTYSAKAVIPVETRLSTFLTDMFEGGENDQLLCKHLDLKEEGHDVTSIRLGYYQQKIYRGYNKGIKNREFIPRDLMLRKVLENTRDPVMGKLGSTWEGPYRVMSIARVGAYRLEDLDERLVARPWNIFNLKYYF